MMVTQRGHIWRHGRRMGKTLGKVIEIPARPPTTFLKLRLEMVSSSPTKSNLPSGLWAQEEKGVVDG